MGVIQATEHLDVLIIGAGVSGIGAAWHLQHNLPKKSYRVLEARDQLGGTWDLFRYPGIRSDSDLHTFGYQFKPWTDQASIADGPAILDYLEETAVENRIDERIRFGCKVTAAEWSTEDSQWTVSYADSQSGESETLTCSWLFCASGYYSYEHGYLPHFEGSERFEGLIIHPQEWPQDLDYTGKRIVVIGSGATAVTIVPAMAEKAAHVTMLQRSPTYVVAVPGKDPIANFFKRHLSAERAYALTRRKNIFMQKTVFNLSQKRPAIVKWAIRKMLERQLPEGYDIDTHFTPDYKPWDQRLCSVPDGDLFKAITNGSASVVTDRIKTFTEHGILLESGTEIEADIIVTATGLQVLVLGGIDMTVDGVKPVLKDSLAYRAMMLSDIPNFVYSIGYTNSSWTLKVDIVFDYACRVIETMDRCGYSKCVPVNPDPSMETRPLLDFQAGYVKRAVDELPREGTKAPWELTMNYVKDRKSLREDPVQDGVLQFSTPSATAREAGLSATAG